MSTEIADDLEFALESLGSFSEQEIEGGIEIHTQFNEEYNYILENPAVLRNIFENYVIGKVLRDYLANRSCTYKLVKAEDRGKMLVEDRRNKTKWCFSSVFTLELVDKDETVATKG